MHPLYVGNSSLSVDHSIYCSVAADITERANTYNEEMAEPEETDGGAEWGFSGSVKGRNRTISAGSSNYGFMSPDAVTEESPYAGFISTGGGEDGDNGDYDNLPELVC